MRELGDVIPVPADVRPDDAAAFTIRSGTAIRTAHAGVGEHLAEVLRSATGHAMPVVTTTGPTERGLGAAPADKTGGGLDAAPADMIEGGLGGAQAGPLGAAPAGVIELGLGAVPGGDEAYELTIATDAVTVRANTPAGLFAAVQTLRQLVPVRGAGDAILPGGRISDRPRLAYRGVMLDVARHFFPLDEVKSFVDAVCQFKINHLHLHLTDDQGWRLEIAGRPRLTEVGGAPGTGVDGAGPGFYTREHYAELVAYAAARFVTVVPEIDMPGHVNAAQVAHPELTCDGVAVPPRTDTAVGYSSLCATSETTYAFAEDVIREVAALTPGPYLHIGGDEAQSTTPEDYRTFLNRVLPLVTRYGKRAIGWHEMAAVELPASAVPQFWRDVAADDGTARAVAAGSQVIMSPADRAYLDMKYDPGTPLGLDWAGFVDVDRAYDWDPADRLPGVGEEALLGVEAALWSETLRSLDDVQTMTFPRLPALAEIGWSPRAARDWSSFRRRLGAFGSRWTEQGIAFHRSATVDWR